MSTMTQLQEMYIGLLGRAADQAGLTYWANEIDQGNMTIDDVRANVVNEQPEYADGLGSMTRSQALNELYNNLFNRDADAEGLEYWVNGGGASVNFDQLVLALIDGAQPMDRLILDNRAEVANYYSEYASSFNNGEAAAVLANVDNTRASVEEAISQVDGGSYNNEIRLTTGEDILNGSRGDDLFTAKVVDNQNTLQSGDEIFGGAGEDTLEATLGESSSFAILAETNGVEIVDIRSQARNEGGNDGDNDLQNNGDAGQLNLDQQGVSNIDGARNVVDAELMEGVEQWWNSNSRADLIIEDVRTNSHETTIGWRDTDAGDVDYAVFFDNITSPGEGGGQASVRIDLVDVLDLAEGGNGLSELPFDGLTLAITEGENEESVTLDIDFTALTSYTDLINAIQSALDAEGYTNLTVQALNPDDAVFSIDVESPNIEVSPGVPFTWQQGVEAGVYNPILITGSDITTIAVTEFTRPEGTSQPSGNIVNSTRPGGVDPVPALTQTDIIFDNVGRGSMSGDFVAGAMSNGTNNDGGSGSAGIEQFNIDVDGNSWIKTLASTNNTLEVVNVENIGANGDLRIGDRSYGEYPTDGVTEVLASGVVDYRDTSIQYGIENVRVFDASSMTGDVYLTAALDRTTTEKYLDLQDIQSDPAGDNSDADYNDVVDTEFSYDLGAGDDTLLLDISASNLSAAGTTNREDFELEINGGEGNDDLTLRILTSDDDGNILANATETGPFYQNWYDNSEMNANLTINAGDGDDVVRTPGSGNVVIDLGEGNDTVYADNTGSYASGNKAVFLFNVARDEAGNTFAPWTNIDNIQSDENNTGYQIYNGQLVVSFKGFESIAVDLPHTQGYVSDLQINQAIKNAINNDETLSKLLEANDGPGNTLVVSSLIDGVILEDELTVGITSPDSLSNGEVTTLNSWYGTTGEQAADLLATMDAGIAAINGKGDYNAEYATQGSADYAGLDSDHVSDNIITGDLGDDVIVLGTGAESNDTVVYEGFGNGVDTIVNFDTGTMTTTTTTTITSGRVESFTINFTDVTASGSSAVLDFDGITIALNDVTGGLIPAEDIALAFAQQYSGAAGANWDIATGGYTAGDTSITLENITAANTPDTGNVVGDVATNIVDGDFVYTDATGSVTVSDYVEGLEAESYNADATAATFTLDFDPNGLGTDVVATADGSLTYFGATINYTDGDGAITLAQAFANASYTDFTAELGADGTTVVFTAKTAGAAVTPDADAAQIDEAADGVDPVVTGSTPGVDAVTGGGTYTETTVNPADDSGMDFIDFTAYDVDAVQVISTGQNEVFGTAPVVGDEWVRLTESATNDGYYDAELVELTDDGIVVVGDIADLDFGVEQQFVADNFLIG